MTTLIENVRQWLETKGFPLEMRVASAFREIGFMVRQSSHYVDCETGKGREIDVIAADPDTWGIVSILFAIECKSSKKPWVLLSSVDTGCSRVSDFAVLSKEAKRVFSERVVEFFDILPWMKKEDLMGYSLRQAHVDRSDIGYSAAMGVAKACQYLIDPPDELYVAPFTLVFPVIVVDAPLIKCFLRVDGQLELELVDQGEFLSFPRLPGLFSTCIRVITVDCLPHFARQAKQVAELIRARLKTEEDSIKEAWKRETQGTQ